MESRVSVCSPFCTNLVELLFVQTDGPSGFVGSIQPNPIHPSKNPSKSIRLCARLAGLLASLSQFQFVVSRFRALPVRVCVCVCVWGLKEESF